jgi:hypothetical protein
VGSERVGVWEVESEGCKRGGGGGGRGSVGAAGTGVDEVWYGAGTCMCACNCVIVGCMEHTLSLLYGVLVSEYSSNATLM